MQTTIKKASEIKVGDVVKGSTVVIVDGGGKSKVTILHMDNGAVLPLNKSADVRVDNSKVIDGKMTK
jgi:hypothetical protein